ncbi:MAG: lipoprotein-releasing ABC transporter permease subunit [Burkholderia sp.]|nr:lipoprotein-releasing ABC transporter permease subunit [Burkholderia sp.]
MKIPYELQIGWRYTISAKSKSKSGFISFIALVSILGIALGVATLIIVLSVMNGFQREVRDRMLSILAHVQIFSPSGSMPDWRMTKEAVLHNPSVVGAAPYVEEQALIIRQDAVSGVIVRGVEPSLELKVNDIEKNMRSGKLDMLVPGKFGIVLGVELSKNLGLIVGDKITLIVPKGRITLAGITPRLKQFTVVGIFESGHYEYDSSLVMINIEDAQTLFRLSAPNGIRLRIKDMYQAQNIASELSYLLIGQKGKFCIKDWTQQNKTWFSAVKIEKRMMFVILTLIIAVATFNLLSLLVMTVTNKRADIAILRTLGAQLDSIMKIFILQGIIIGFIGTGVGIALGCLVSCSIPWLIPMIEHIFGLHFLPQSVYFINELPSKLVLYDVIHIGIISFLLSAIATIYPSWHAAKVQPAEALRYE